MRGSICRLLGKNLTRSMISSIDDSVKGGFKTTISGMSQSIELNFPHIAQLISLFIVSSSSLIRFRRSIVLSMTVMASIISSSSACKSSVIWCIRCIIFFMNITLMTKSTDCIFQERFTA